MGESVSCSYLEIDKEKINCFFLSGYFQKNFTLESHRKILQFTKFQHILFFLGGIEKISIHYAFLE